MISVSYVCVSVRALLAEPFDVWTQNLVEELTLAMSQMSWKVVGQRSKSLD